VRAFRLTLKVAFAIICAAVIVSGALVLTMRAEMIFIYGPQVARIFTVTAWGGIACAVVASVTLCRPGRRP
jgi:hypothetical protein